MTVAAPCTAASSRASTPSFLPMVALRDNRLAALALRGAGVALLPAACEELAGHLRRGDAESSPLGLWARLAPEDLGAPDLPAVVAHALSGLEPQAVCLAVPVAGLLPDIDGAIAVMGRLRAIGLRLAVDGFGGPSGTLALLRRLPVDAVAVDERVVGRLGSDRGALSMVLAIVSLARGCDLLAITPGVCSLEALRAVTTMGVDLASGPAVGWPEEPATS